MVDLSLETRVLLLAELELEFDDLLLFPQIGYQRPKFGELGVCVVGSLRFARVVGRRSCSLLDTRRVSADGFKVLVEKTILITEVLAPGKGEMRFDVDTCPARTWLSDQRSPCRVLPAAVASSLLRSRAWPGRSQPQRDPP